MTILYFYINGYNYLFIDIFMLVFQLKKLCLLKHIIYILSLTQFNILMSYLIYFLNVLNVLSNVLTERSILIYAQFVNNASTNAN